MLRPLLGLAAVAATASAAQAQVVINEVRIDMPGADVDEYFELHGAPLFDLTGLTYVVLGDGTGASGVVETVVSLDGFALDAAGLFVAADEGTWSGAAGAFTVNLAGNALNFENSDNVTHLLVSGFTGALAADLDTDDDGVLDVTPWTSVLDRVALISQPNPPATTEFHYGPPAVGPEGTFVPGHVHRYPDGAAVLSGWNIGLFAVGSNDTALAANGVGTIPDATGGSQVLDISAGAGFAGDLYLVVCTASGTAPGLVVDGIPVPLNFDALTSLSITQANSANFSGTLGFLDATGGAFAKINVPAGLGLAGITVNSVALVLDLGLGGKLTLASNPTAFTIIP
ncbi:MAG TPA: hypothetical protein VJP77_02285 [Planctomycetota bacterium]|nr:hypothetical protein [Planctomycetota bacterium]